MASEPDQICSICHW